MEAYFLSHIINTTQQTKRLERLIKMKLNELLLLLNSNLKNDKKITEEQLTIILLDVSRILDKEITKQINDLKKTYSIKITSSQKEYLRKNY